MISGLKTHAMSSGWGHDQMSPSKMNPKSLKKTLKQRDPFHSDPYRWITLWVGRVWSPCGWLIALPHCLLSNPIHLKMLLSTYSDGQNPLVLPNKIITVTMEINGVYSIITVHYAFWSKSPRSTTRYNTLLNSLCLNICILELVTVISAMVLIDPLFHIAVKVNKGTALPMWQGTSECISTGSQAQEPGQQAVLQGMRSQVVERNAKKWWWWWLNSNNSITIWLIWLIKVFIGVNHWPQRTTCEYLWVLQLRTAVFQLSSNNVRKHES